jgi:RNA polymerase sigma-70 factor (ECF subfamily)
VETNRSARPALETVDEAIVVGRAADGDERAFEVLIRRYGPLMRAYAARLLGDSGEADDAVQDAYVTAWQQLATLQDANAFKSWLMRILSRKCVDRIRARQDHDDILDHEQQAPEVSMPESAAVARSREEALSIALDSLPEQQRRCWILREIAEHSYEEIAEELLLPVSTVRGLLARARRALVREMEEWR